MAATASSLSIYLASNSFTLFTAILIFAFAIQSGAAIMCWECNSHYDKNCADPFSNSTFAATDCDMRSLEHYPGQKATVCRKIIQKVRNDYRFIRGCGWLSSDREEGACVKRAGTFNVLIQYCSCDNNGCNAGHTIEANWRAIAATLSLSTIYTFKTALEAIK